MLGVRHIHFTGIGGIGMSALAELLLRRGMRITGSDLYAGATVVRLQSLGVPVSIGHDADHVGDADVLVHTSAVGDGNPELVRARERAIPVIGRGELLAEVMRGHDGIAIAGSHGKTTTTSLLTHVLAQSGLDPTAVVGGRLIENSDQAIDRRGIRQGKGKLLVAEADESDGSFLLLNPIFATITSIDAEHLDHYGTVESLRDAFVDFANALPFWGVVAACSDDPGVRAILPRLSRRVVRYGLGTEAALRALDVEPIPGDDFGMRFRVERDGETLGSVRIPLPGSYNVANALAALALALELEVPFETAVQGLATFAGVERRFEHKGVARRVRVVDDYGHHPTEIVAVLAAARTCHTGRLVVVFQPHRYTRTRDCFDGFSAAFGDADQVIVTDVYAASEAAIAGASGEDLALAIRENGHAGVRFVASLDLVAETLPQQLAAGDLVITLGAGDVSSLGPRLLSALQEDAS